MNPITSRVIALEPEPERGRRLTELIRERVDAEVIVVHSWDDAPAALSSHLPDVILISSISPPTDEAKLLKHLRELDTEWNPAVLFVPPIVEQQPSVADGRSRFSLAGWRSRAQAPWPPYDVDAIGCRISEALGQSSSAVAMLAIDAPVHTAGTEGGLDFVPAESSACRERHESASDGLAFSRWLSLLQEGAAKVPRLMQATVKNRVQQAFRAAAYAKARQGGRDLIATFTDRYRAAIHIPRFPAIAKVPQLMQATVRNRVEQVFRAAAYAKARQRGRDLIATFKDRYRAAMDIPRPTMRSCVLLLYASLTTASKHWRGIPMTATILRRLQALRAAIAGRTKEEEVA